jgi:ferredoxin
MPWLETVCIGCALCVRLCHQTNALNAASVDVCNGHPGMSHMTTPKEFYDNVVIAMNYLDTVLPKGSHVLFMGLADGRVLYESMHDRIHPLGSTRYVTDNNNNKRCIAQAISIAIAW